MAMTKQEFREWRLSQGLRESDVAAMFGELETAIKNMESGRIAVSAAVERKVNKNRKR